MFFAECRRKRVAVLAAGFHNLSREALSDFNGLREAAPFRYESRNVRTGTQIPPTLQGLHSYADGHFFHLRQMHFRLHDALRYAERL
jgi:hypothetical protein